MSKSLFLYRDKLFFDKIGKIQLPDEIAKAFYMCKMGREYTKGALPTWEDLYKSNMAFHMADRTSYDASVKQGIQSPRDSNGAIIQAVFGSLDNPYTNTNIVLATRQNVSSLKTMLKKFNWGECLEDYPKTTLGEDFYAYLFMLGLPACHTGSSIAT